MALTKEQIERRRDFMGGSDANILIKGDPAEITNLWLFKRRLRDADDLSNVLQVALGSFTESFNRAWFEKQTGHEVKSDGDERISLDNPFMSCTLDGLVYVPRKMVFEAKHTGAFSTPEQIQEWYWPQVQHNIYVTGAEGAFLSVIYGNHKWEVYEIERDDDYIASLIEIETKFWNCVETGEMPVPPEAPPAPKIEATRKVDMTGNNMWADNAATWLEHKDNAKSFDDAAKAIKEMVEDDAAEASGHGIVAKRSKTGSITIRKAK